MDDGSSLGVLEREDQRLLAAVEGLEPFGFAGHELGELAPRFTLGRLDLDDFGAHVGQVLTAERSGDDLRELEDADPDQWS
jgi:hypothetical protein